MVVHAHAQAYVVDQTYNFLLLQNTTRTIRIIANTTAHATATPIKTPDPLLLPFVLVSFSSVSPTGFVTKDICKEFLNNYSPKLR